MYNELLKAGLTEEILKKLSYHTNLKISLTRSLRHFEKQELLLDIKNMIYFYNTTELIEDLAIDCRIKSIDSCIRKYDKFYPEMRVEKTFNDILGFRLLCDNYDDILEHEKVNGIRIADMSSGKANDDGYRGVHMYYQMDHQHYPIEIQVNTFYDRQMNNWLHKYLYKKKYANDIGVQLRKMYENGEISNEKIFKEMLEHVLFNSKKI